MKNYLKYELKKNLWAFVVIAAVCTIPYVIELSSKEMVWQYDSKIHIQPCGISSIAGTLTFLTFIIPILTYSFKMNKRSVDAYYSLPLKKEKIYFVKTLTGLFLTLGSFSIAYWLGFFTLLFREGNPYNMGWYVPAYFGLLALGTLLYGFNSFIFTRGNKVADGVVFMIAYMLVFELIYEYGYIIFDFETKWWISESFMSWGGVYIFGEAMDSLICYGNAPHCSVASFVYPVITGVLGYVLLFYSLRFEKAEDAEQVSESRFGYKFLIPVYAAFLMGISYGFSIQTLAMILIAEIIATIVYKRKFRFEKKEWLRIGLGLLVGIVLGLIANAVR